MELALDGAQGLPEDTIISIRAGSVRRQAALRSIDKPFRFPCKPEEAGSIKVDAFSLVASGRALCDGGERVYRMGLDPAAGGTGGGSCSSVKGAEIAFTVRPSGADGEQKSAEMYAKQKEKVRNVADEYLDQHKILPLLQGILQGLMKERPDDPYHFIAKQFHGTQDKGAASPAEADALPQESAGPPKVEAVLQPEQQSAPPTVEPLQQADVMATPPRVEPAEAAAGIQDMKVQARRSLSLSPGGLMQALGQARRESVEESEAIALKPRPDSSELPSAPPPTKAHADSQPIDLDAGDDDEEEDEELSELRESMKLVLIQGVEDGGLQRALSDLTTPQGQLPDADDRELQHVKDQVRSSLLMGADSGRLIQALGEINGPGDPAEEKQAEDEEEAAEDEEEAAEDEEEAAEDDEGEGAEPADSVKDQVRASLLKGAESGALVKALSCLDGSPEQPVATREEFLKSLREALLQASGTGELSRTLVEVATPL